jgi:plasmid segregation protein ParM
MWVSAQRESFTKYLMKSENVRFDYNGRSYNIHIVGVTVFPQGYCAVYDRLKEMDGLNMIADIGNGTMNLMKVSDRKVITDSCRTEKLGVDKCVVEIKNAFMNKFHTDIDESIVVKYLIGKDIDLPEEYADVMKECADEYCKKVMNSLYKYDYNSKVMKLYVVGGGAVVMKNFADNPPNTTYITDICANAKGYEFLAQKKLRKNGR